MSPPTDTQITGSLLDCVFKPQSSQSIQNYLEPTAVDVKRLRDDRSEIQPGDEIAFVATVTFRITHEGVCALHNHAKTPLEGLKHLAKGDALFAIESDGEVVSTGFAIDEDSVAAWLAERFSFTFLLNDAPSHAFGPIQRTRGKPDEPWIQKLNTAALRDDYIDVDVKIDAAQPTKMAARIHAFDVPLYHGDLALHNQLKRSVTLHLHVPATAKVADRMIVVPLDDYDDGIRLQISFADQPNQEDSNHEQPTTPRPAAEAPLSHHKAKHPK